MQALQEHASAAFGLRPLGRAQGSLAEPPEAALNEVPRRRRVSFYEAELREVGEEVGVTIDREAPPP